MNERGDEITGNVSDDAETTAIGKDIKQEKNVGGQASSVVNIYPTPEKPRSKRRSWKPSEMSATVEHELRRIVAAAELRIDDMQALVRRNERVNDDAFEDLRRDMKKLREATRPLDGQGILAASQQAALDEATVQRLQDHNKTIVGLVRTGVVVIGVVGATIVVILILAFVLWPIFSGA